MWAAGEFVSKALRATLQVLRNHCGRRRAVEDVDDEVDDVDDVNDGDNDDDDNDVAAAAPTVSTERLGEAKPRLLSRVTTTAAATATTMVPVWSVEDWDADRAHVGPDRVAPWRRPCMVVAHPWLPIVFVLEETLACCRLGVFDVDSGALVHASDLVGSAATARNPSSTPRALVPSPDGRIVACLFAKHVSVVPWTANDDDGGRDRRGRGRGRSRGFSCAMDLGGEADADMHVLAWLSVGPETLVVGGMKGKLVRLDISRALAKSTRRRRGVGSSSSTSASSRNLVELACFGDAHPACVSALAAHPREPWVASGALSSDNTICVRHGRTLRLLRMHRHAKTDCVKSLVANADHIIALARDHSVHVWHWTNSSCTRLVPPVPYWGLYESLFMTYRSLVLAGDVLVVLKSDRENPDTKSIEVFDVSSEDPLDWRQQERSSSTSSFKTSRGVERDCVALTHDGRLVFLAPHEALRADAIGLCVARAKSDLDVADDDDALGEALGETWGEAWGDA